MVVLPSEKLEFWIDGWLIMLDPLQAAEIDVQILDNALPLQQEGRVGPSDWCSGCHYCPFVQP